MNAAGIAELTAFLPRLYADGFVPIIRWGGGEKTEDGAITLPWPDYDPAVTEFMHLAAQKPWDDTEYDPSVARRMLDDDELVRHANLKQARTMLTYCVRGERFCDGHWAAMIESGRLRRLLERLEELANTTRESQRQTIRTSISHPLRVEHLALPNGARIGMTLCPGKHQLGAMSGAWRRDLDADLARLVKIGAAALVSLVESHEFEMLKVPRLPAATRALGIAHFHLPITDQDVPGAVFDRRWYESVGPELHGRLDRGEFVVLHCMGGLGRTGTIAARLLIERGAAAADAIGAVRAARPGTIENVRQERWLVAYAESSTRLRWAPAGAAG